MLRANFSMVDNSRSIAMPINMGRLDQYVRIVLGLTLVAFAFKDGLYVEGWHWVGLLGFVFLLTAFFRTLSGL